jgi:Poxvirus A32 protein.
MRIVKQSTVLPINNNDIEEKKLLKRHGELLPSTIRCLVVGPSNCGKTNVMISLIEHPNGLKFENIYIFSKSLYQSKYQYLEELLKPIKGIGYYSFINCDNIPPPEDVKRNSIFIFDDVACDKQNVMRNYFSMGRHKEVDCFYLCQTYTRIPKHLIRDNANMLIVFKQDDLNLKHIYEDHINTDMSFNKLKEICSLCWKDKYGFMVISKDNDISNGRYRKGFDHYIHI